jgi:hypothetical protein
MMATGNCVRTLKQAKRPELEHRRIGHFKKLYTSRLLLTLQRLHQSEMHKNGVAGDCEITPPEMAQWIK